MTKNYMFTGVFLLVLGIGLIAVCIFQGISGVTLSLMGMGAFLILSGACIIGLQKKRESRPQKPISKSYARQFDRNLKKNLTFMEEELWRDLRNYFTEEEIEELSKLTLDELEIRVKERMEELERK